MLARQPYILPQSLVYRRFRSKALRIGLLDSLMNGARVKIPTTNGEAVIHSTVNMSESEAFVNLLLDCPETAVMREVTTEKLHYIKHCGRHEKERQQSYFYERA